MAYIKYKRAKQTFVSIPTWFITDYMPKALSGDLKVYLYLFALANDPNGLELSLEDVSVKLDMLYSEVLQALHHWNKKKVLSFNELPDGGFELEFFLEKPMQIAKQQPKKLPLSKTIISQTRPEYRTEEITLYMQDSPEVTKLFKIAEQYLGRLLTITDQKILYSFYDWLHMPFDLIEFLIEHCASNNHKAIHYIEKVAIAWVDEGITTLEEAKEKVAVDKRYFKILKALGASHSNISLAQKKCIDKWTNVYEFNYDIILEACKRAVMQTNNPSLNYVDSILSAWHTNKVKKLEDIELIDKAYESKKALETNKTAANKPAPKTSKFTNIYSHNWDFDELEQLENEYIDRKLNGGN